METKTLTRSRARATNNGMNVITFDELKARKGVGLTYADIELVNEEDSGLHRRGYLAADQVRRVTVRALVDSGSLTLAINETVQAQLGLPKVDERGAELADGSKVRLIVVGPVEVRFENRSTTVRAVVLPGNANVLLGAIPIEDMDVLIDLNQQRLVVNPAHPDMAVTFLK